MADKGSVTNWIQDLKNGNEDGAQRLWERYYQRLVNLARRRLAGSRRRLADEDDVAQMAFICFCAKAKQGRFPKLADRDDLWKLLVVLTARKALDEIKWERRKRRSPDPSIHQSKVFRSSHKSKHAIGTIEDVVGREPTPQFAALIMEEIRERYRSLETQLLKDIAQWKLEGYTNAEIAHRLGRSTRYVERHLAAIRDQWQARAIGY